MADSAAGTGMSNAASGAERAEGGERRIVPETAAGMEPVRDNAERNDVGTLANDPVSDDRTDVNAAGLSEAAGGVRETSPTTANIPVGGKKKSNRGVAVPALLEAARTSNEPTPEARFRVFVIDTGWNETAHKVLRKLIPLFDTLLGDTPTYWLDRKTSMALLGRHRELIGCDPILCVHDLRAVKRRRGGLGVHGLRLHLGLLRSEDSLTRALQMVIHFLARHEASANFEAEVRSRLQLEGLRGAVAIMAGVTPHNDLLKV